MFFKLRQKSLKKKYGKYNIPIKKGNTWYYVDKNLDIALSNDESLMYQFEQYANVGFHFHYEYGKFKNVSKSKIKEFKDLTHSHDFYYLLDDLYDFPETFTIPKSSLKEYSKQEIDYIETLRKKLLKDKLKDIGYFIDSEIKERMLILVYNVGELRKRNIDGLKGISIKKYIKNLDNKRYIYIDDEWKVVVI